MKKLLSIFLITLTFQAFSQEKSISGSVKDEAGMPLLGVTVLIKGVAKGTVTDFDGDYNLRSKTGDVLIFSYLGTDTKEITVGDQNIINVVLIKADQTLDEVVVVGYGTVKKSDLTGSVSSIKAEEITKTGAIGIEQALAGRAAGVVVNQASGAPGSGASVRIRGISSLSGSDPLYVIDGIPMENESASGLGSTDLESASISPLSMINPSDIQSIEILKDASSTAIYGSRGANGVILITTKTGVSGKGVITVDHDYSLMEVSNYINLLDANDYTLLSYEADINAGRVNLNTLARLDSARAGQLETTDWQKEIMQTATSSNTNIGFSGGNKDLKYLISTNILDSKGIVEKTDYNRISNRVNLTANISDKVKVVTTLNYSHVTSNQRSISTGVTGSNNQQGAVSAVIRALRSAPTLNINAEDDEDGFDLFSPVIALEANEFNNLLTQFRGNISLQYKLSKKWSLKTDLSHQNRNTAQRYYQYDILPEAYSSGGIARTRDSRYTRSTITNTINYRERIGKHVISALIGQSLETSESEAISISNAGFANDLLTYYAPNTATFYDPDQFSYTKNNLSSWFGRLNYNYQGKYLLTLTGRYEGSSKFAANNKWGFFPAAAIAYNLSKENFIKDISAISELKLRASYGLSGNQVIPAYGSLDQYAAGQTGFDETLTTYFAANQLPNDDLTWETTAQLDLGLDFGIFNNKFTGSVDYYQKVTDDLLFNTNPIPIQSGFQTYTENFGSLETKGFEMNINAHVITKKDFLWTIGANYATGKSVVTDLASDYVQSGWNPGFISGGSQRLIIGEEVGAFYGYKTEGIAQFDDFVEFQGLTSEEQINLYNSNPSKGDYTFVEDYDGGVPQNTESHRPGQQLYDDLDGDGSFTEADRQIIGRAQPNITFGLNNNFKIGDVDVSFFIDSQLGRDVTAIQNTYLLSFDGRQGLDTRLERWTPENPSTIYPRLNADTGETIYSDRFVEDASFVRLQNFTIGYTFPKSVVDNMNISNLRFYLSGSNLYTWTKYTGYNPDVSLNGSSTRAIGHDNGGYPLARTIRLGLKLKF
ncbi:SusC/RagA family TonB-linked outer membrane protein [Algibacter sp. L3A6]|uniref:SusC/RagA family TonB-linked outer membrane protein n=1 Tax=Algibacter sp. L3A6 TaxID=2686366 RepID=UPI00131D9F9A|nr:TonB-dependent receptor [Algibacter sp. L3A6]